MRKNISHEGIIERITCDNVYVRIVQSSACSSCKIASACNSSEKKEKIIEIANLHNSKYNTGDKVNVIATESTGMKAVGYAFVIPLVIMLVSVFAVLNNGGSEAIAGISGIIALIPYYILLYFFKGYFKKIIVFYIEQTNY